MIKDQCYATVVSITEEEITLKSFDGATHTLPSNSPSRSYGLGVNGIPFIRCPEGLIYERDEGQILFYENGTIGFAFITS